VILPPYLAASAQGPTLVTRSGVGWVKPTDSPAIPDNLTPRPGIDRIGLSTFDNLEAATPPGGKAQVIDTNRLTPPLVATPDAPPPGQVSISPLDPAVIDEWAATRGTGQIHPLIQVIMDAIIDVVRRPK
jgi:hypothetical protein